MEDKRTDGALDSVVVEIDTAIVEEADEAVPARERVADRLAETALCADLPTACLEEVMQVVHDRAAELVADVTTLGSSQAADLILDGVE